VEGRGAPFCQISSKPVKQYRIFLSFFDALHLRLRRRGFNYGPLRCTPGNNLGQVVHTRASVNKQYKLVPVNEQWCMPYGVAMALSYLFTDGLKA